MDELSATALAHPNIAFIKYWGNRDDHLRIPANGSISMNLGSLQTITKVTWTRSQTKDSLVLNKRNLQGPALDRVSTFLDIVRKLAGKPDLYAVVKTMNNFPTGAGIASSASAFAALAVASSRAIGLELSERELSRLARRGSGSACRSIPGGFVEWLAGSDDEDSYAETIAPTVFWDIVDCVAVIASGTKDVGSTEGHKLANSSPLQAARVADAPRRLDVCRKAIRSRDFDALAAVVEVDSNIMHAVMMTSEKPLFYWESASLSLMKKIPRWRKEGLPVCYTLDAGANVHVITVEKSAAIVQKKLWETRLVHQVLYSAAGGEARILIEDEKN
jgi:diphosphomevalonate decarboxylase